mgnify:CR=1 FL=1
MNTRPAETVLVCKVCQRFLNHAGVWVYVEDFTKFLFALTNSSVEHIVCPQCLSEQQSGMVEDVAVVCPIS